jgi:hypothetical protein
MSSIFSKPKPPPPPIVEEPPALEEEDADAIRKSMRKRKGRAQTILTGDLVPADTGQTTLLGGR